MATDREIEIGAIAIATALPKIRNKSARCRKASRLAIEAIDQERDRLKRASCTHPNKRGSGTLGSDGSGSWEWYCPDCGISTNGKTPPRTNAIIPMIQNGGK